VNVALPVNRRRVRKPQPGHFRRALSSVPARFAILVFTLLILVWTTLLVLPASSASGEATPVIDALFTAVSAICVTGLSTVDMAGHWSVFGDVVIVLGMQVGAIGVLSLASLLGLMATRRLGLRQRLLAASDSNPMQSGKVTGGDSDAVHLGDMRGLLGVIASGTLILEAALTVLMLPRMLFAGFGFWHALGYSVYLASASFTNTGFVPFDGGLKLFFGDAYMLSLMSIGVFLGSIGFPVLFALRRYLFGGGRRAHRHLGLHAKLTLTTTLILLVLGWIIIAGLEWNNPRTLGSQGFFETLLHSGYTSMMTRSGGFTVVNPADMQGSTHLVVDMLMFVGGGSASTAGGVKVTTLAILFLAAWSEARGYSDIQAFGRRIPVEVLRVAVSVVIWGATIVATSTIILTHLTGESLDRVLFEVISGFATCGLSTDLSSELPTSGKAVLAATIWAGRVGTVTLAAAVAATSRSRMFRYPEERPIVG
jgi:trk system potassium uptake protein TrkH